MPNVKRPNPGLSSRRFIVGMVGRRKGAACFPSLSVVADSAKQAERQAEVTLSRVAPGWRWEGVAL